MAPRVYLQKGHLTNIANTETKTVSPTYVLIHGFVQRKYVKYTVKKNTRHGDNFRFSRIMSNRNYEQG